MFRRLLHKLVVRRKTKKALSSFQYSVASILGKVQWDLGSTALSDLGFIMVCKEPPHLARLVRISPQGEDARKSRTLGLKETLLDWVVRAHILAKGLMIYWFLAIPHLEQDSILDGNVIISISLELEQLLLSFDYFPIVSRYTPQKTHIIWIMWVWIWKTSFLKDKNCI